MGTYLLTLGTEESRNNIICGVHEIPSLGQVVPSSRRLLHLRLLLPVP